VSLALPDMVLLVPGLVLLARKPTIAQCIIALVIFANVGCRVPSTEVMFATEHARCFGFEGVERGVLQQQLTSFSPGRNLSPKNVLGIWHHARSRLPVTYIGLPRGWGRSAGKCCKARR
jgi:hypothetical protein